MSDIVQYHFMLFMHYSDIVQYHYVCYYVFNNKAKHLKKLPKRKRGADARHSNKRRAWGCQEAPEEIQHKEGRKNKMKKYNVYVDGQFIGTTELTEKEVKIYNTMEGVAIERA